MDSHLIIPFLPLDAGLLLIIIAINDKWLSYVPAGFPPMHPPQRQVILEELCKLYSHPTAADLYAIVRRRLPSISLGTVYRNLELLARLGTIRKLELTGAEARFDGNTERHDHLRCVRAAAWTTWAAAPLISRPAREHDFRGYEVLGQRLEFFGVCPQCRAQSLPPHNQDQSTENTVMLKANVQDALNKQLNAELASSYLYLSMAAWFEEKNFRGMGHWMRTQAQEEYGHAMKFYGYIIDRGGRVVLGQINAPKTEWGCISEAFQDCLQPRDPGDALDPRVDQAGHGRTPISPRNPSCNGSSTSRSRKRRPSSRSSRSSRWWARATSACCSSIPNWASAAGMNPEPSNLRIPSLNST